MLYHSIARKTYPGFHNWTIGFICISLGAALIALRGILPDFLTILCANFLILAMPYMLTRGLEKFLNVQEKNPVFYSLLLIAYWGTFFIATYIHPNLFARVICISILLAILFSEALYIAYRFVPAVLESQNWLLITMISFALSSAVLRIIVTSLQGTPHSFMQESEIFQCILIIMTTVAVVGITQSLIILNAHRMERDLRDANRHIANIANQDGLTNLYNRRYFDRKLLEEFSRLQRTSHPLSLIMADIDCFKNFNDTYGHQAGDDCIRAVANVFRKSGGRGSDISARYGGEEFVMILPNTGENGARNVAETLQDHMRKMNIPHKTSTAGKIVTLSLGVTTMVPDNNTSAENLVQRADKALYKSKENGRNQICIYIADPSQDNITCLKPDEQA